MDSLTKMFDEFYGKNIVFGKEVTDEQKAVYRERIKAYFAAGASAAIHIANQRIIQDHERSHFEVLDEVEDEASSIYYRYVGIDREAEHEA